MVREGLTEEMTFDGEGVSMQVSGGRAFRTEGTAVTDARMQERAWFVPRPRASMGLGSMRVNRTEQKGGGAHCGGPCRPS